MLSNDVCRCITIDCVNQEICERYVPNSLLVPPLTPYSRDLCRNDSEVNQWSFIYFMPKEWKCL